MHESINLTSINIDDSQVLLSGIDIDSGENIEKAVSSFSMINLNPIVDYLYSMKPVGNPAINEYRTIVIESGANCTYNPKDINESSWSILYVDMPIFLINNIVKEILLTP